MSKMSQLNAELTQQAAELGFMSIEEAEANGYKVDYDKQELVPVNNESGLNEAHEAWLKEREEVVAGLNSLIETEEFQKKVLGNDYIDAGEMEILTHAVRFIKEQCHD